MLLWIGLALLAIWALGLLVFHLGTIIYVALIVGLGVLVYHWVAGSRRTSGNG